MISIPNCGDLFVSYMSSQTSKAKTSLDYKGVLLWSTLVGRAVGSHLSSHM